MHIVVGTGYLGAPRAPRPATLVVDGEQRCTKCGRWLPLCQFESKGQRGGRQVRRGVCEDCRQFRQRVLTPTRAERRAQERERVCKACGRTRPIVEFPRMGGVAGDRPYRLHVCRRCYNAGVRQYIAYRRRKAGTCYRPTGARRVLRDARLLRMYGAPQVQQGGGS